MCPNGTGWVTIIIVLAGALGGALTALREWSARPRGRVALRFFPAPILRVLEGLVAAAVVPLFLSLVANDDLTNLLSKNQSTVEFQSAGFRLFGFCLVAAVAARRFLEGVTIRVLNMERQLRAVERKVDDQQDQVGQIADAVIETATDQLAPERRETQTELSHEEAQLLSLFRGAAPARSVEGLALSLGSESGLVSQMLENLENRGLVRRLETFRGARWVLTPEGTAAAVRFADGK